MKIRLTAFGSFPVMLRRRTLHFVSGQTVEVDAGEVTGVVENLVARGALRAAGTDDVPMSSEALHAACSPIAKSK
jgi:hypothetical protein